MVVEVKEERAETPVAAMVERAGKLVAAMVATEALVVMVAALGTCRRIRTHS